MHTSKLLALLTVAVAAACAACTVSRTPAPPLQGPSELGLSLTLTADPSVLSMDGASQSQITIEARDANGQLLANVALRAEILANGSFVDFGSLSARTVVTGSNGRASVVYTAPVAVAGAIPSLAIRITPAVNDAANIIGRYVDIRLVPPGVITGPAPTPSFTVTPAAPVAFSDVRFDASASTASLGASIASYAWTFGDGSSASGVTATHRFTSSATFHVVLTVTDSNGVSASTSKDVAVGAGTAPKADFTFSPTAPLTNQGIFFNGALSTPGAGHSIVRYDWNFGSGSTQSGITVTKSYDVAATYNVTLTVTDEVGQTALATKSVTVTSAVGGGAPTASYTFSPTAPAAGQATHFNGSASTTPAGTSITAYDWNFGDGTTGTGVTIDHTFAAAGTYVVRLTVTNGSALTGTTSQNVTVTVSGTLAASFTISPTNPVVGTTVNFNGSGSIAAPGTSITNYAWVFGDGTSSLVNAGATATRAYTAAFTYTIRLTVTDNLGRTATVTTTLTVAP